MDESTSNTIKAIEALAITAANVAAPMIGGATVQALISIAAKYGPETIDGILAILGKGEVTVADVQAAFEPLKPYSAYGIPDKIPTPAS